MTLYLLDDSMIDSSQVKFDPATYQFYDPDTGQDLTDLLKRADKRQYPGFDDAVENDRLYRKQYAGQHQGAQPAPVGSTSATALFFDYTKQDLTNAAKYGVQNVVKPVYETAIIFGVAGLVVYFLLKGKK